MIAPPPVYVESPEEIEQCIRHCFTSDMLGVDSETLGLLKDEYGNPYHQMTDQVVVMGLSPDEGSRYLVPRKRLHHFKELLEDEDIPKALTNIKFDAHRFMNTSNIQLKGPWVDTPQLDYMLDEDLRENRHGLKPCAWDYFKIPMAEYKELFGNEDPRAFRPGHPQWEKYLDYSSLDPWVTRKLALYLISQLDQIRVWKDWDPEKLSEREMQYTMMDMYWETEEPQLKTLWNMERRGILVSDGRLAEIEASLTSEMEQVARELNRLVGEPINPNSGDQVGKYLFETLGLPNKGKTTTGKWKTSADILKDLALGSHQCQEAALVIQYKKASKLRGTYARGLAKWVASDGRIHTSYSATKTTGRLGSKEPNLQNVPRPDNDPHSIRAAFIPGPGKKFIVADYGQLEMRIMAFRASTYGDHTMLNAIMGNLDALEGDDYSGLSGGLDMHSFTASRMLGMPYKEFIAIKKDEQHPRHEEISGVRTAAKAVGFGIIYGIQAKGLSAQLSKALKRFVSESEAQGYIDLYLETFPGVHFYMMDMKWCARENGYVQTLCGRFRRLSKIKSKNRSYRGHAERQAINAPIQGSAADIVKRAMILIENDEYLKQDLGWYLLHQVHDELILEGPEETAEDAAEIVQYYMAHPFAEDLPVELEVEPKIVDNWKEGK
jgi:DNA polymerase-1